MLAWAQPVFRPGIAKAMVALARHAAVARQGFEQPVSPPKAMGTERMKLRFHRCAEFRLPRLPPAVRAHPRQRRGRLSIRRRSLPSASLPLQRAGCVPDCVPMRRVGRRRASPLALLARPCVHVWPQPACARPAAAKSTRRPPRGVAIGVADPLACPLAEPAAGRALARFCACRAARALPKRAERQHSTRACRRPMSRLPRPSRFRAFSAPAPRAAALSPPSPRSSRRHRGAAAPGFPARVRAAPASWRQVRPAEAKRLASPARVMRGTRLGHQRPSSVRGMAARGRLALLPVRLPPLPHAHRPAAGRTSGSAEAARRSADRGRPGSGNAGTGRTCGYSSMAMRAGCALPRGP